MSAPTVSNSTFDELTYQAQAEQDPDKRAELYAEAERILAAEETAYAPIYHYTSVAVTKPWLTRNYPSVAPTDFFNWKIDWEAKLAATGR
jgi:ABC-type transport system substrate-binding protein